MTDRAAKITLTLAVAIPWAFMMVALKGARTFLLYVPLVLFIYIAFYVFPGYFLFRRCRRILQRQGGAILSHNVTYSEFSVFSKGTKIDVSTSQGSRGVPPSISFSTVLDKESHATFSLSPYDLYDKMVRKIEKKVDVASDNNLIIDRRFKVTENAISSASVEHLLSDVRQDLLESVKARPSIDFHNRTAVVTFHIVFLDDTQFERYLQIVHGTIDSLSQVENQHRK